MHYFCNALLTKLHFETQKFMSKKKNTGCSQVSLCLSASMPEERQLASILWDKTLCLPFISKLFAIKKHNFRCLQHNTMQIIVIESEKKK